MSWIGWIVFGLIAGFIASKIVNKQGEGFIGDIILGVLGAVAGGWLFERFGYRRQRVQPLQHVRCCDRGHHRAIHLPRDRWTPNILSVGSVPVRPPRSKRGGFFWGKVSP